MLTRLKITYDLPPIEPRPPVPPRIYKKLCSYLQNVLPNRSTPSKAQTPGSRIRNSRAVLASPSKGRGTLTREESLAKFRTPTTAGSGSTFDQRAARKTPDSKIPESSLDPWIVPVIRFLCTETYQTYLSPTLIAGMEHVVLPGGQRTEDEWINGHLTPLLATIYYFVDSRVKSINSGHVVNAQTYIPQRKQIRSLLSRARAEADVNQLEEEEAWAGWTNLQPRDFDAAVEEINGRDWLAADWYRAIADVVKSDGEKLPASHGDLQQEDSGPIAMRRADTMFQEKYDLLSEARRADYKVWKADILSRINQLQSA